MLLSSLTGTKDTYCNGIRNYITYKTVNFIYNCMPLKAMTRWYVKTNPKCYYNRSSCVYKQEQKTVRIGFFENLGEEPSKDVRVGRTNSFF
jgi:hypothetical protein